MAVSTVLFTILLLMGNLPYAGIIVLMLLIGLCHGAVVPGLVIIAQDAFPGRSASASSVIVFGISIASLSLPVSLGAVIEGIGYLPAIAIYSAGPILSALVLLIINRTAGQGKSDRQQDIRDAAN